MSNPTTPAFAHLTTDTLTPDTKYQLLNGTTLPLLSFGTFQLDGDKVRPALEAALEAGYTFIDTAALYLNEYEIGQVLTQSGVDRSTLQIQTKLWPSGCSYDKAKEHFYRSLEALGLDYLDSYLIHHPFSDVFGAWRAMEELYQEGLVKAIGVSNFTTGRFWDLSQYSEIKPMINQLEVSPLYQRKDEIEFYNSLGVSVQAHSSFGRGGHGILTNANLLEVARKHNKSVAQVIIRWLLQLGVTSINKSSQLAHMQANLDVFDFELDAYDMYVISEVDTHNTLFIPNTSPAYVDRVRGHFPKLENYYTKHQNLK